MMKKILCLVMFNIGVVAVTPASEIKVGTVDLQKALQEVKKGKNARSTLEKEFNDRKAKIEVEQNALKKIQEELEKVSKNVALSQASKDKKIGDFQKRAAAFQELVQRAQMEMQGREAELTRPIIDGLRAIVPEVAKAKKVDLAFEGNSAGPTGVSSNPLLYAPEKVDLTSDVIKAFDEKN